MDNNEDPKEECRCEYCSQPCEEGERLCFWCVTIEEAIAELLEEAE